MSRADPGRRRALHTLLAALLLLALPGWLQAAAQGASAAEPAAIELFVREGCLHCAEAEAFVAALQRERPGLRAEVRDVAREPAALARLERLVREHGTGTARVPAFHVGGELIVGYSAQAATGRLVRLALAGAGADTGGQSGAASGAAACTAQQDSQCERKRAAGKGLFLSFLPSPQGRPFHRGELCCKERRLRGRCALCLCLPWP